MKRVAALDLGTNSFLCLIVEGDSTGIKKIIHDSAQVVRLGQDINKTKMFHPEALKRMDLCLEKFKSIIDKYQVDQVLAMATSAARDAKNKNDFFEVCKKHKIPVNIISGADEARITYQGATANIGEGQQTTEKILIVDIGGGSTELILGQGDQILFSQSLNIGCVRLTEQMISQQPVSNVEHVKILNKIENELDSALQEIKKMKLDKIIAVAGTPTALVAAQIGQFDPNQVEGHVFSVKDLNDWVMKLKTSSTSEKISKFKIESGRADIIYIGALILWTIVQKLDLPSLKVSIKGVRYGVAVEMLRN
ncbi:MAG: Ppx/GppA family phosphatase [Bdellovibrionota bacterium]